MGFTYPPVIRDSQLYNPLFYASLGSDGLLTYDYAQTLYLGKNDYRLSYISGIVPGTAYSGIALVPGNNNDISGLGAVSCASLTIDGTPVSGAPDYVAGITPGTAAINKALVLGPNKEIATISSLTATSITGTLQTAAQPNITSLGTLSSLTATSITGTLQTAAQPNITSLGTLSSLTIGGNLTFTGASRTITGLSSLSASTLSGTIQTAAQPNITSLGTLSNLTLDTGGIGLYIPNLKFWDGVSAYTNFNHAYFLNIVEGGASAITAVVLSSTKDYTGIRDLTVSRNFTASTSVSTPTLTCDTISKSGTQTMNATTLNINPTSLQIRGTTLNATGSELNKLSGCTATTAELNYLDLTTGAGTAEASKALVLDANSSITSGITSLTSTNLISTTATQCQIAAGTTFSSTTRASDFNLIIRNQSDLLGSQAGISFTLEGEADMTTYTPSVLLYCTRTAASVQYAMADFAISTTSGSNALSPMTERLRITQGGYVRMGSSASNAKVDITSSSSLLSGSWQRAMRIANDQATPIEFEIQISNTASPGSEGVCIGNLTSDPLRFMISNTTKMYLNDSGRLGVNNTSPEATIHAGGEIWANNYFHCKGNGDDAARYRFNWSQTDYPAIGTDATIGAIRIGKCNASYTWTAYVPVRGGSYTNASDERLKTDIIECPYGLDTIMQIRPKKFKMAQEGTTHVGFIAQEMYHIVPEAVDVGANDDMNDQGYPIHAWGIDLASLTSVLCKAIQELKSEVDDLKKIVATLQ